MKVRSKRTIKLAHRFDDKLGLLEIVWLTLRSTDKLSPKFKGPPSSAAVPCPQCEELARAVRSGSKKGEPWDYQKARLNGCSTCRKLRRILEKHITPSERSQLTGSIWYVINQRGAFWTVTLSGKELDGEGMDRAYVDLVREGRVSDTKEGIGVRPLDHAIDKTLIASWIRGCDNDHAGACHSFQNQWAQIRPAQDILLIDVEHLCLASQSSVPGPLKYVALSYVWGDEKHPFQTLQNNVSLLSQPNAFSEHLSRVPLTVQDSMALISSLGLKYLWVDRFCIIQDADTITEETQLAAMASIYTNAYFTIAAREGDAQSGLAGSRPERPRRNPFETFRLNSHCQMLLRSPTTSHNNKIPRYDQRGWTFQEWTLSRRILVFHRQTVFWTCFKTAEQENGVYPGSDVNPLSVGSSIWVPGLNNGDYLDQVDRYCQRELTFQDDKLRAFNAIIAVVGRSLRGRMLYGLPELFFSESLPWTPKNLVTSRFGRNNASMPSWSWAAWTGLIDTSLVREAFECTLSSQINGRGRYFCMVKMEMLSKVEAVSSSDQVQDRAYWARKSSQESNGLRSNNRGLLSGVPVLKGPDDNMEKLSQHPPFFIRFSTERICGFLTAESSGSKNRSTDYLGMRLLTENTREKKLLSWPCLCDRDNNVIGYLDMRPDMLEDQYIPQNGFNTGIELISIGGLELPWYILTLQGANYLHRECPKSFRHRNKPECAYNRSLCKLGVNWKWRFYNVLWIEWKGKIAYRKGVGKIWADCWEKLEREEIEVTLG